MAKKSDIVKAEAAAIQSVEQIESLILTIRGKQVILDRDLARLYGVETRRLNEQVRRNMERFPEDFMFQLTREEFENWKSQFAISNYDEDMSSQIAMTSKDATNMSSQFVMLNAEDELSWSQFAISSDEFLRSQIVTIENEDDFLRSQNATIDMRGRHLKYLPYAFTENGVAMLSSALSNWSNRPTNC